MIEQENIRPPGNMDTDDLLALLLGRSSPTNLRATGYRFSEACHAKES